MVEIKEVKAKRRLTDIDCYEVSGVDKAANGKKFLIFKRLEDENIDNKQSISDGGENTMTKKEDKKELTEEQKAQIEEVKKKIGEMQKFTEPFKNPDVPDEQYLEKMAEVNAEYKKIFARAKGKKTTESDEKEDDAGVTKEDDDGIDSGEIASLESEIASEKKVMTLKTQLADLQKQNKKLEGLMPVRKFVEPEDKEMGDEQKGNIVKMYEDISKPENKKKYLQNPDLLMDTMKSALGTL